MLKLGAALIAAVLLTAQAQIPTARPSEPPAKSQRSKAPAKTNTNQAAKDERGTDEVPLVVKFAASPNDAADAQEAKEAGKKQAMTEKKLADDTWYLALWTFLLVVVAAAQAGLFVWQLRDLRKSTNAASANAQAALISADTAKRASRAYVKMSHYSPGIEFIPNMGAIHLFGAIRIKNFGHTPAHVTDVYIGSLITPVDEGLPAIPEYPPIEGREISAAFLVADDEFIHRFDFAPAPTETEAIRDGTADLYIIGYVDYRDRFGDRHRGSYARIYDLGIDDRDQYPNDEMFEARNNLTIVSAPRYNDDRLRTPDEGVDWDD